MPSFTLDGRRLSTLVGCAILAFATNATVLKQGGWFTSQALLAAAMSCGVFAGARALVPALRQSTGLAVMIIVALIAGEFYNLLGTGERIVMARAEQAAPLKALAQKRQEAIDRLKALGSGEIISPRVSVAREALRDARKAVDEESANGGCRRECQRKQGVADQADAELRAALAEAETKRPELLRDAKQEVERNPVPVSSTVFADATGWPPWVVDLIFAGLLSFGANGLAATLIAFGSPGTGTSVERSRIIRAKLEPGSEPKPPYRARSRTQRRANEIAAELRNRNGEKPRFHVVRDTYRDRYGDSLPKVTAHRACR